ncbi:MAG: L,D-transpeptidase family protein [Pseudomonadota bacterium]
MFAVKRFCWVLCVLAAWLAPLTGARALDLSWSEADIAELAVALNEAWTHGLDPRDYADAQALITAPAGEARDRTARLAFLAYAEDLAFGKVDPRLIEEDWTAPVRDIDLELLLVEALGSGRVFAALEGLAPNHPDYAVLRRELVARLAVRSSPPAVPSGPILETGSSGPRVDALRRRLVHEGLYQRAVQPGAPFDARLETALMRYQTRHNLAATGALDRATMRELSFTSADRIAQLRANLERWRWLPHQLGERHIRVNIADYRLEAWANGRIERVHETMIGSQYASTPVFSEDMSYIELNPIWYAPGGLGSSRLRAMRSAPAWALSQGYRLVELNTGRQVDPYTARWGEVDYRIIQRPGPNNAMGEVKFMFPNRHNVYIHDTPHRDLFANVRRTDSSGCVRVQDPEALAAWVLETEAGWSLARLREVLAGNDTTRVYLDRTIPVHILYFTAVSDRFGEARFIHDVYNRDAALIAALDSRLPVREAAGEGVQGRAP